VRVAALAILILFGCFEGFIPKNREWACFTWFLGIGSSCHMAGLPAHLLGNFLRDCGPWDRCRSAAYLLQAKARFANVEDATVMALVAQRMTEFGRIRLALRWRKGRFSSAHAALGVG
jgi:hypothetical protein